MIYKAFLNTYTNEYIETIQERVQVSINGDTGFEVTFFNRLFNNKPRHFKELNEYSDFLSKLDFKPYIELNWETTTLSKKDSNISLGYCKEYDKITFMTQDKTFEDIETRKFLQLESLTVAPQKYITTK